MNVLEGKVTYEAVAEAHALEYVPLEGVLRVGRYVCACCFAAFLSFVGEIFHDEGGHPGRERDYGDDEDDQPEHVQERVHLLPRIARCLRACVIVLDAVGAGALPDAGEYGDEGADTLGNVARAVGGLDLPNLEALGLGNVEGLRAAPTGRIARGLRPAGRAFQGQGHDARPLGADGHRHPAAAADLPARVPHDVIDPFMHRTARGVLGNKHASGTEIIQELGEEHQETGKWIVYTSRGLRLPDRRPRGDDPARGALRGMPDRPRDPHRKARGRPRDREAVHRRARELRADAQSPRLLARAEEPDYLTLLREAGVEVHAVGKIGDIFAGQDIDETYPTKSNVEGITKTEELLQNLEEGFVFTNLVETDMLWGHRNDPINFHRCLQDFDRRLSDLLEALRPGDLLVVTSDHGCDPTTPGTDHTREHAPLLAYVHGKNADGRRHDGEFADVGATVNAWLGGKAPGRRLPGMQIVER